MQTNETTIYVACHTFTNAGHIMFDNESLAVFDDEKKAIDWIENVELPRNLSNIDYENIDNTRFDDSCEEFFIIAYVLNGREKRCLSDEGKERMRSLNQRLDDAWNKAFDIKLGPVWE